MSEIEPYPRAMLAHHYPETPLHGDFTTIQAGQYEPIDVLVGGTPCQSFSIAGLRGGMADERGNLALEYLRLADRLRPQWVVWENVPGVLSSNGGRDFGAFLGGLGQLGYGFAYRVFDAQFFGLAQRRARVFVVGYLGDWRRAAEVLFEPQSLRGDSPPRRKERKGVAADAGIGVAFGGNNTSGPIEVSTALNASGTASGRQDFETETFIVHTLRGEGFDASEDGTGRGIPLVPVAYAIQERAVSENPDAGPQGKGWQEGLAYTLEARHHVQAVALRGREGGAAIELGDDVSFALRASGGGGDKAHVLAFGVKDSAPGSSDDIAPTLRSMSHAGSHANGGGQVGVALQSGVRRLTPTECERLMGFPDGMTAIPYRNGIAADGPRYKALGNSMAVPILRWIGERIDRSEKGE